jgi:serine protease Do
MNKKNKIILYSITFVIVLFSGFIFGHYVFTTNRSISYMNETESSRIDAVRQTTSSRENAITETVKKVSSAVVGINVTEIQTVTGPFDQFFGNDPFFRQFFGNQQFKQEVHGLGSGFIVTDDGYIITNDHVVGNATKVVVSLTDGENIDAKIVGTDHVSDIALLKIDKGGLPFITMGNSDDVIIGEWAIALGNPFGLFEVNQKPTVTVGVISATNMRLNSGENRYYRNMLQTDAAINSGNSGGPLVNSVGEVIGMNTLIFTGNSYSSGNIGLGFAIPINKVKKIVDLLKKNGKIDRNYWIGLRLQTMDQNIANYYKLKNTNGAIVVSVESGSPADKAGIKPNDIITGVNGQTVASDNDFWGIITDLNIGDDVKVKLIRDGDEVEKEFVLKTK